MTDHSVTSQTSTHNTASRITQFTTGIKRRLKSPPWVFRAVAVGLCLTSLVFVGLLLVAISKGGEIAFITKPPSMRAALLLPYVVLLFTGGTVLGALAGWWQRYWSVKTRIHQTILALLGVTFSWQLAVLGFL